MYGTNGLDGPPDHQGRQRVPRRLVPAERRPAAPEIIHTTRADWVAAVTTSWQQVRQDRVAVAAGAFAYRWFLSLFPMLIALLEATAILGIPRHVVDRLVRGVDAALPAGAAGVLKSAIESASARNGGSWVTVVVAALVAAWSATSGMVMVEEGLDMAYEIGRDRSFVEKRLLAIPLLLASTLLGGSASALVVFGTQLGRAIDGAVPVAGGAFALLWNVGRWIAAVVLVDLLLAFLYWLAPNQRTQWRWASPGSVLGTALWALVSLGFSFYTTSLGDYAQSYGALAGVAILIFWLFLTGLAILLGAELNAAFARTMAPGGPPASKDTREAQSAGSRGKPQPSQAQASTSTRAPRGRAATATAERAGRWSPKAAM
jgi:membrane protein